MALQNVVVEVAFTATPFADPATLTWTDVSAFALAWSTARGRADEQPQMQAGTAQVTLDNADGRFDPDNGSSPYSPNVLPGAPIRLSTTFLGTTYRLFYGFVESWEQHYDNMVPTVNVTASDGLKAILSYSLGMGYTEMLVSDYGGTVGSQFAVVWPWQLPNLNNYYLNDAPADVVHAGDSSVTGVAETGKQFSGSSSYLRFDTGSFYTGFDSWFRIDSMPAAGAQTALLYAGGGTVSAPCAFGYGDAQNALKGDDAISAWVVNFPQNLFAANVADPSVTTNWTLSGVAGSLSSVAATVSNVLSRIWTDTGATDLYGATKALKATLTASGTATLTSPFAPVTAGQVHSFSASVTMSASPSGSANIFVDWYTSGGTLVSSTTGSSVTLTAGSPAQLLRASVTAPATATQAKIRITVPTASASWTLQVGQLSCWQGTFPFNQGMIWYAGGSTPSPVIQFVIASGTGVAPPGQTSGAFGWPCYGTVAAPSAGTWFHLAADSGRDNGAGTSPYINAGLRMPSAWLNGVSVRLWTTVSNNVGWANSPISSLGAKFITFASPTLQAGTSTACTVDESYLANSVSAGGEVTAAKALAHYNYGLTRHDFVQQLSGARVDDVLDAVGWPSSLRAIDAGTVTLLAQLPGSTGSELSAAQLIQDAGTAEGGLYFVGSDGSLQFWDQAHVMGGSPVMAIGDGATDVHYMGWPVIAKDDTHIFNLVVLTQTVTDGSGVTPAVVQVSDATSQTRYNVRSKPISAPWANESDMAALAAAIIADYKNPAPRVSSVSVEGVTSNAFASLLARELGDYIQVHLVPSNYSGPALTINAFLQGLSITGGTDRTWVFAFSLAQTIAGH